MNIYKFCRGWDRKPGGEKETLLKKFTQRSLTGYSTFISGSIGCENVYMLKLLGLLELKLSFN